MFSSKKLYIRPICSNLQRNTEAIGKMDPFVTIRVGDKVYKTKVADNQGKFPAWNEIFEHKIRDEDLEIEFKVMDDDTHNEDDFVGSTKVPLVDIRATELIHHSKVVPLYYKGKVVGNIAINLQIR